MALKIDKWLLPKSDVVEFLMKGFLLCIRLIKCGAW